MAFAIDFAFIGESPLIDTGFFPIPFGLKSMLQTQNQWENFKDLCWEGFSVIATDAANKGRFLMHYESMLRTATSPNY